MLIEDQLRERLKKVEALYFGATTAGERDAAEAAAERLKAKLEEACRRHIIDRFGNRLRQLVAVPAQKAGR
jgi:hypothetical protein